MSDGDVWGECPACGYPLGIHGPIERAEHLAEAEETARLTDEMHRAERARQIEAGGPLPPYFAEFDDGRDGR